MSPSRNNYDGKRDSLQRMQRSLNSSGSRPRMQSSDNTRRHGSERPRSRPLAEGTQRRQRLSDYPERPRRIRDYERDYSSNDVSNLKNNSNNSRPKKKKKKKNTLGKIIKILLILIVITSFACAGGLFGVYMSIIEDAPKLELVAIEPNVYTSIIYDANGQEIDRLHGDENREYATLEKIPEYMQNAIISIEDARFYSHNGIDIKGILRAVYSKLLRRQVEGASTITQQLIKNNVTKVIRNTYKSKIQEQYLAIKYEEELEKQLGSKKAAKDYILELYLNTVYFGHSYNGVQAAALGYLNKDVSELTLAECAVIAGITNNPSIYSPRTNPENNNKRQLKILGNMLEQGYITKAQYDEAVAEDVYSKISNYTQNIEDEGKTIHSFFVDGLFEQVSKDLQEQYNMSVAQANNVLYNGGLQIYATIDQDIQKIVDEAYLNEELFPNVSYGLDVTYTVSVENTSTGKQEHSEYKQFVKSKEAAEKFVSEKRAEIQKSLTSTERIIAEKPVYVVQPQSAMVIMDYHNGEVKALAGGRGEKTVNRGLNRAIDSARQPGSVFKVLASFAPGIDTGTLTPATVIDDVPIDLNGYKPKNWYSNPPYRGLSTIRDGIRDSMNIVAVKAMVLTGIDKCYEYLLKLGFTTLQNDNHASTALGGLTNGITQLEVTAAYGAIANKGEYLRPMLYSKVLDHDGNVLLENKMEPKRVFKETSAFLLTDMMKDVITSGTGTKAKFKNSSMPIAGKTGTTQESKDLTFVGYTPYYVAGIWLGYDRYDNIVQNMSNLNQSTHLELWRYIMEKVHEGLKVKSFEKPSGIVTANICMESGKLAVSGLCTADPRGNRTRTEYFAEGTQPKESCDVHKSYSYCSESKMPATEFCPKESLTTGVGIVRPTPYTGSASVGDTQYQISGGATCNIHTAQNITENESTEDTSKGSEAAGSETDIATQPHTDNSSSEIIDSGGLVTPSQSKPSSMDIATPNDTPQLQPRKNALIVDSPL